MADSARLLDSSAPLDVPLLDQTVKAFYFPTSPAERAAADKVLQQFQKAEGAWSRVDSILEQSSKEQTKFFALQILEDEIRFKWGRLPVEQREGIKTYVSNLIIKLCTAEDASTGPSRVFLRKLDLILVHILKHEWPQNWPSFLPELVGASKTSEALCENSMHILKLLSEEIFDFNRFELIQAKTKALKKTLNEEFRLIHDLCVFVLHNSTKTSLLRATLDALHAYLTWIPLGYIFESNIVMKLLEAFPQEPFRNVAVKCLTEVASLQVGPEQVRGFVMLYTSFMNQLAGLIPPGTDLKAAYESGTTEQQDLVQNLALFFTSYLKNHITPLEAAPETHPLLLAGLDYLISISYVDDNEVFKTCLDYWNYIVPDIYASSPQGDMTAGFSFGAAPATLARRELYHTTLSNLRALMISRMAKPEEVLVIEDENGNIVREQLKDNDVLVQYKTMRETLVYLAHLDHDDTEKQMLDKLRQQSAAHLSLSSATWHQLNTLCWAIGSISGSMYEEQENRFLVTVIRDLLNLCEVIRGKDNKAVVASNIMYVVGQYPRFLRAHWKFLKTVVNKLFEFMHETHPGVQDMACDTFLKICHKCKRKFVLVQPGEKEPFLSELLTHLTTTIHELQLHQIHTFYEAAGLMVLAEGDALKRKDYLARLMAPPNDTWAQIIATAGADPESLKRPDVMKNIQNILQTNVSVCQSVGQPFMSQLTVIYMDMLQVYKMYSELISVAIANGGPHAVKSSPVRMMRSMKKAALKLVETYVERCEDVTGLHEALIPALMDPVLADYARNMPDAREAEVLSLFATIINTLKGGMQADVPRIFEAVFECTLQMITLNFEDHPEHRLNFFSLLHAITIHCFHTLFTMSPTQLKLVLDSIVWAFRHTERNVAETGLSLLYDLLLSFKGSDYATDFHRGYYTTLLREVFVVLTDTMHKPGLKQQARILQHLFGVVQDPAIIRGPLWPEEKGADAYPSNAAYIKEYVTTLLTTSFSNLTPSQIETCVTGMFELREFSTFKHHLRDFLVQTKQFADQNNADLFADEVATQRAFEAVKLAAIPGMINPNAVEDGMDA